MHIDHLEVTNYCIRSAVDNYQVHEGLYWGMKISIRAIRSVAEIEEFRFTRELQDIKYVYLGSLEASLLLLLLTFIFRGIC